MRKSTNLFPKIYYYKLRKEQYQVKNRLFKKNPAIEDMKNQEVLFKYINPSNNQEWYVLGGSELPNNDYLFFGMIKENNVNRLDYFKLSDLKNIRYNIGNKYDNVIIRDTTFNGKLLKDVL